MLTTIGAFFGGVFIGMCCMALWIEMDAIDDQGEPLERGGDDR